MSFNKIILFIFLPAWLILEVIILKWVSNAEPKKNITSRYSKKVIFLSRLPFGSSWKKSIYNEDIKTLERFNYRIKIWYLSIIGVFLLFVVYLIIII
jgi:hypothetical protein